MAKVEIYTWQYCPFCIRAKSLLDKKGVKYKNHKGGCSLLNGSKNFIESSQNIWLDEFEIKISLNINPANIDPKARIKSGNNITNGDSCMLLLDITLLL